jgi:hypothetical protein
MPTPPFSSDLVTKLAGPTAWRFDSVIGEVLSPRWVCCTSPNSLGLTDGKEPVAITELSPNPAYAGETVNYAGTLSYDPDGSIASYAWTFEGHTPSSGTASSGTLNYGTAGVYTIGLTVTDGTSLQSLPARVELVINPVEFSGFVASSTGVYYSDTTPPVWTAKNTGLSGDDLITYDVKIDPSTQILAAASKVVWRGGRGGIQVSVDGGATWAEKNPASVTNTWSDSPAPTVADLTFRQLLFTGNRLFAIATWQNGSSAWRSWLLYTDDAYSMRSGTAGTVTWSEVA